VLVSTQDTKWRGSSVALISTNDSAPWWSSSHSLNRFHSVRKALGAALDVPLRDRVREPGVGDAGHGRARSAR
jgi:hypothetical protein